MTMRQATNNGRAFACFNIETPIARHSLYLTASSDPTTMIPRPSSLLFLLSVLACQKLLTVEGGAVQLTIDNFEALVDGKNIFIKFFAPWCGHCRSMADDWNKLADEYAGNNVALIGEVDCTSDEGKPVCEDFDVQGFPTIVYGDPMSAETYDGGRDYDALSAFAKIHVGSPVCSIYKKENCSEKEQKTIDAIYAKSNKELETIVAQVELEVQEHETVFDTKVVDIQKQYDDMVEEFNKNLEVIKEIHSYKFVEQILHIRLDEEHSREDEGPEGEL